MTAPGYRLEGHEGMWWVFGADQPSYTQKSQSIGIVQSNFHGWVAFPRNVREAARWSWMAPTRRLALVQLLAFLDEVRKPISRSSTVECAQ